MTTERLGPVASALQEAPPGYPPELESDVLLSDGRAAVLRPVAPEDAERIRALHSSLSDETIYFRFFTFHRNLSEAELQRFANVDYLDRLALVAFVDGELVAVARYDRPPGRDEAEVAFTIRDDQQGRGLGTVMLEHLASAARARGIRRFVADTLTDNSKMLGVFRGAGFVERASFEAGVVRVTMELDPVPAYLAKVEERDRRAAVASIERLLRPGAIAVVGASPETGDAGHEVVVNLLEGGFTGRLYLVGDAGGEICGLPVHPSMAELPEGVDVAVVAVPAAEVADVVTDCGRRGVSGLVVMSAGFAERGEAGRRAERELVEAARFFGMRVVGPNCIGIVNTSDSVSMNATYSPVRPTRGRLGFSSQSGGLGIATLGEAAHRDLGVSSFVAVGNKADVSGNDLLRYWESDPDTDVILMYLESFGNPRHFARISRRISRTKPIVAVKSGRSRSGSRGATLHTAAAASADAAVDALFRQAGVIRVDTLEELFDVADVLSHQPLPRGGRVAIVANAGGPGVLAADACEGHGLIVPELSLTTQGRLRALLAEGATVANPVDCVATATADAYGRALEIVLADDVVDAVIVIFTPPLRGDADTVASAVAAVAATADKPVLAVFLSSRSTLEVLRSGDRRVPWFAYPESAARALGRVVPYARWRQRPEEAPPLLSDADPVAAAAVVTSALGRSVPSGELWLDDAETAALLAAYGIALGAAGSEAAEPGVEVVCGLEEDPAFGPLVTVGLAGAASEVLGDRALALVPLAFEEARRLIASLKAAPLLEGYGGGPPADTDALAGLLCRLGRLAEDLPEVAEMELSPVVVRPAGSGCVTLTARARVALPAVPEPALRRRHLR